MRARLTSSPSNGHSEVLETLHFYGALHSGTRVDRLVVLTSNRYQGDNDKAGSDPQFTTDLKTVLAALATAAMVSGHDAAGGAVDLTASQPDGAFVVLTGAGRVAARHPRPRPRVLRG